MSKLRELARGQPCMVRIPGVCSHNPETVVLAHLNLIGISGRGLKAPDQLGAWCCSSCHDEVDRRTQRYFKWGDGNITDEDVACEIDNMFYEGIFRTQYELIKMGVLK